MADNDQLDAVRVDYPAPKHVPKDRLVDLSVALGFVANDLVDPYEPCGWLTGPDIPHLLFQHAVARQRWRRRRRHRGPQRRKVDRDAL